MTILGAKLKPLDVDEVVDLTIDAGEEYAFIEAAEAEKGDVLTRRATARISRAERILKEKRARAAMFLGADEEDEEEETEDECPPRITFKRGMKPVNVDGLDRAACQTAWALAAQKGDQAAADSLLKSIDKLILGFVNRYARKSGMWNEEIVADLYTETQIALLEYAIPSFDPTKAGWITHAMWRMKSACHRYMDNHSRLIRLPAHVHDRLRSVRRHERDLSRALGRRPTDEEVCAAAAVTLKQLKLARDASGSISSLDAPIKADGEAALVDLLMAESADEVVEKVLVNFDDDETQALKRALAKLSDIQRFVIEQRYIHEHTLDAVGRALGVSRERVRQHEMKAMLRLRKFVKRSALHSTKTLSPSAISPDVEAILDEE